MLKKREVICLLFFALGIAMISLSSASFNVNSLLIKMSLQEGGSATKPIVISSDSGGDFELTLMGLPELRLSENNFSLNASGKKTLTLYTNSSNVSPGFYANNLKITGPDKEVNLPIVLEIESSYVLFDANIEIPSQYSQISPGDSIIAQIKMFDLTSGGTSRGLGAKQVNLHYSIHDFKGNTIYSENEKVVINGETQATKTVSFPKDMLEGDYVFSLEVNYLSSIGIASQIFSLKKQEKSYLSMGDNLNFLIIVGAVVLFFLGMIVLFVFVLKDKNKFIVEMRKYNALELQRQKRILSEQVSIAKKKGLKTASLEKEVEQKISELKAKQVERVNELNALREKGGDGSVKEMQRKIANWKSMGYHLDGKEYRLSGLSTSEMQQAIKKWKKKYKIKGYKKK